MNRISEDFVREFGPWVLRALAFIVLCRASIFC